MLLDDQRVLRELGDLVVEATDGGSLVTVTTDITGPGAEGIGGMVTADAPTAVAALVAMAESAPAGQDPVPAT